MKIALIQLAASKDLIDNLNRGVRAVENAARSGAEVVVFPELAFTRFFPQNRLLGDRMDLAEPVPGPVTDTFCGLARRLGVVIILNLFERDGNLAFDTSPVIDSDGSILGRTRMMHITQYEGFFEQDYYDPGDSGAPVYNTSAGKIGVAICYDRHYPEYMRALALAGAEVVVIPQAGALDEWPEGVFDSELQSAAFQNGFFIALANRVGKEEVLTFAGGSLIVDPSGQVIARAPIGEEATLIQNLDLALVPDSPARQLFLRHRRDDQYEAGSVKRGVDTSGRV